MSADEIDAVLARYPDLEYGGWHAACAGERPAQAASRRKAARRELTDPLALRQFGMCLEFIAGRLGGEDPHGELVSSVELKRALERWYLHRGTAAYTCQGMMIVAMLTSGYSPRVITPPSCCFLVSPARLSAINRVSALDVGPARNTAAIR